IVVPLLVVLFGESDLVAKGTSLLMVIATGISGTVSNVLRKNVDPAGALTVGVSAAIMTPLGVWTAHALAPAIANIVFAAFLVIVIVRMLVDVFSRPEKQSRPSILPRQVQLLWHFVDGVAPVIAILVSVF